MFPALKIDQEKNETVSIRENRVHWLSAGNYRIPWESRRLRRRLS